MTQEKMTVNFVNSASTEWLGTSRIPVQSLNKLLPGDVVEFKDMGFLFGLLEVVGVEQVTGSSEAVTMFLRPVKVKGKIKLHHINQDLIDTELPF